MREQDLEFNPEYKYAKGGKTKKFPKGFIDYVEESDNVYEDNGLYYNVETQYAKAFTLQELYDWTQKEGYEFAKGGIAKKSEYISNRDIVSLTHKKGGTKKTLKGSQLVDGAYAKKKIMRKKPTKSDQLSLLNKGGEIVRAYDVNINSGVGTYAKGGKIMGVGKSGLDKIKKTSKQNPKQMYKVTDDNYSNIGNFYLKNGKFAKMTSANADYDFAKNKVSLRPKSDVIYKATEIEGKGGYYARGGKSQGYNAQLDESLGMRRGSKRTKQQSDKDRRDESKAMSKSMGRRAYAGVRGMDKGRRKMANGGKTYKDLSAKEKVELRKMQEAAIESYRKTQAGGKAKSSGKTYKDLSAKEKVELRKMQKAAIESYRKTQAKKMAKGGQLSWSYKEFKGDDALEKANKFISNNKNKYQTQLIFINDGFGVEYRPLRKMAVGGKTTMAGDTDFPSELLNYSKGGKVSSKDVGETIMVIGENNVVGDLIDVDGNTAFVDFSDYENRPRSGKKRDSFNVSEIKVVQYDFDKDGYYAKGGNIPNLKVTDIKYNETRRGISYIAKTNVKGVEIVNDGMGGATFLEGSWKDIKPYNNLDESDLEALINVYEKVYAKGGKFASGGNVSYNGWTNYATWVTNLEILDGIDWKEYNMGEPISAEQIEDYVQEVIEQSPNLALSFANRFLYVVNYRELAETANDDFDLDDGEKDEYAKGGKMKKPMIRYSGRR